MTDIEQKKAAANGTEFRILKFMSINSNSLFHVLLFSLERDDFYSVTRYYFH
jgi:hypothetical protein